MVRAKMRLDEIVSYAGGTAKTVVFRPAYDASIPEDQRFMRATPSGELRMFVDNPAALDQLKLGEYYYLDFTPVPKV